MDKDWYENTGWALGGLTAVVTFFGGWIYCTATYGFLFGFGLGWLPSGIAALLGCVAIRYLWGVVAVLLALGVLGLITGTVT